MFKFALVEKVEILNLMDKVCMCRGTEGPCKCDGQNVMRETQTVGEKAITEHSSRSAV